MWIGQGVSAQLPSVMGWMEKLLLGGQQVGRVVQAVQGVEEVHLVKDGGRLSLCCFHKQPLTGYVQCNLSSKIHTHTHTFPKGQETSDLQDFSLHFEQRGSYSI